MAVGGGLNLIASGPAGQIGEAFGGETPEVARAVVGGVKAGGVEDPATGFEDAKGFVHGVRRQAVDVFEDLVADDHVEGGIREREGEDGDVRIVGLTDGGTVGSEDFEEGLGVTDRQSVAGELEIFGGGLDLGVHAVA
jgi:hypothetical protein